MRALILSALLAGLAGLSVSAAHAGAWTLPQGDALAIVSATYKVTPPSAVIDARSTREEAGGSLFVEYGLTDDLTLGLTGYGDMSLLDGVTEFRAGGHARYRLWQGEGRVISVQAGAGFPVDSVFSADRPANSVTEVDGRVLYGQGWQLDWADTYISTELGYRLRTGAAEDEIRFDGTAGLKPFRGLLGLLNVSAKVPLGGNGDPSLELTPSLAYTFWPSVGPNDKKPFERSYPFTIQFGVGVDALEPRDGIRFTLSLWKRF